LGNMGMKMAKSKSRRPAIYDQVPSNNAIAWFAVWQRACATNDRVLEGRARDALARCGILVIGVGDIGSNGLSATELERIIARIADSLGRHMR
jgi:hypothetical protein